MRKHCYKNSRRKERQVNFATGKLTVIPWNPSTTCYSNFSLLLKPIRSNGLLFPTLPVCAGYVSSSVLIASATEALAGTVWGCQNPGRTFVFLSVFTLIWFWGSEFAGVYLRSCNSTCIPARNTLLIWVLLLQQENKAPVKHCTNIWLEKSG